MAKHLKKRQYLLVITLDYSASLLSEPSTSVILCLYIFSISSRAGPQYLRGSNSPGFSARVLRTAAVKARRESESMLILQTALLEALRSCSSGIPTASGSLPPYSLMMSTYSWGTLDEPWSTMGKPGSCSMMASRTSNASGGGTSLPVFGYVCTARE